MNDWTVFGLPHVDGSTDHYCEPTATYIHRSWRTLVAEGITEPEARALVALLNAGEQHES